MTTNSNTPIVDGQNIFRRLREDGNYDILFESGEAVEHAPEWRSVYPVGSDVSTAYQHPAGIVLTLEQCEAIGIPAEG